MSFENAQFIDTQNGESILNLSLHEIRLPFPPTFITVSDFINKRETSSRIFRKSPNAFFIYRKAFTNYLTFLNFKLTMIDVSRLVSNHWKNESKEVKDAYGEIAKEIDVELKEKRKHDKICPVVWKNDKKSKKQKRTSRRNFTNNSDSSRNTTDITFEFQNFSVPVNENNQRTLRSHEEMSSQPITYPIISFPGAIQGYNFVNYHSCYSPSNESEEESYDCQATYQNLNPGYCSRLNAIESQFHSHGSEYSNFVSYDFNINDNLFAQYSLEMNPCINESLTCQQGNELH